jgi:hypothetical protein
MNNFWLKLIITLISLVFIVLHLRFPEIRIDLVTTILLIIAILPWFSTLIESAEFPGGWKVKFRDVESAGNKITGEEKSKKQISKKSYYKIREEDPNLALVGLRIEIEKKVRALASSNKIDENLSLTILLQELRHARIIDNEFYGGTSELIKAGNKAAHGAKVESQIADWAFEKGPSILNALDQKLSN